MAKPDTWMPFYPGDYLRDTMHLTTLQHGAYLLLIIAYWTRGGPLSDDPETLSAICRTPVDEFQRTLNARCREFFVVENGVWRHKRIDEELAKANRSIEQKRQAGLASANARSTGVQQPLNSRSTSVPTASQRTEGEGEGEGEETREEKIPNEIDTPTFRKAWTDWREYRRVLRKPLKEMTANKQLKFLADQGERSAVMAINESIRNGWQGLFEPKTPAVNGHTPAKNAFGGPRT